MTLDKVIGKHLSNVTAFGKVMHGDKVGVEVLNRGTCLAAVLPDCGLLVAPLVLCWCTAAAGEGAAGRGAQQPLGLLSYCP